MRQAADLVDGIFYAPLDYVSCVRRCLRAIRPALVIILETEIWPNLYMESGNAGARVAVVNGRISDRTWPRYRAWRWFFEPVLRLPDLVLAQSVVDQARYAELGVPSEKLGTNANLKYDAPSAAAAPPDIPTFGATHVWIAASTVGPNERGSLHEHEVDEDDLVIAAFQALALEFPRLLLILAPRQPARFDEVALKLARAQVQFLRRTALKTDPALRLPLPGVLLLDTIGELAGLYKVASAVFVGGSLAPRGGHNVIEPAAAGAAIVVGPHMHNFEAIAGEFLHADAMLQISSGEELLVSILGLLRNGGRAKELGQRAQQLVERRRGPAHSIAHRLLFIYYSATPRDPHNLVARAFLGGLALLWTYGGEWKRRTSEQYAYAVRPLSVPVISVGGITLGGSGKTPFTNCLARCLLQNGYSPAILTRGYRRRSPAENLVLPAGSKMATAFTGDEAQIFLRAGLTPLGIGANRYTTAQILLRQFPETGALLLDDGFQHARLLRDLDIVIIDGLDPFGRENVVRSGGYANP